MKTKYEYSLKCEDDLKYEDELKFEDDIKYEDDLKYEDNLKSTKPNKIYQTEPTKLTKPKLPNQKYQKFALSAHGTAQPWHVCLFF